MSKPGFLQRLSFQALSTQTRRLATAGVFVGANALTGCGNSQPEFSSVPNKSQLDTSFTDSTVASQVADAYQACAGQAASKFSSLAPNGGAVPTHVGPDGKAVTIPNHAEVRDAFNASQTAQSRSTVDVCVEQRVKDGPLRQELSKISAGTDKANSKVSRDQLLRLQEVLETDLSASRANEGQTFDHLTQLLEPDLLRYFGDAVAPAIKARSGANDALAKFTEVDEKIKNASSIISNAQIFIDQPPAHPDDVQLASKPVQVQGETNEAFAERRAQVAESNSALTDGHSQALENYTRDHEAWISSSLNQYNIAASAMRDVSVALSAANAAVPTGASQATDLGRIVADGQTVTDYYRSAFGDQSAFTTAADFRSRLAVMSAALNGQSSWVFGARSSGWVQPQIDNTQHQVERTVAQLKNVLRSSTDVISAKIQNLVSDVGASSTKGPPNLGFWVSQ